MTLPPQQISSSFTLKKLMRQMAGLLRTTWTSGSTGASRTACGRHTCCWTGVPSVLWWWTQCRTRAVSSTQLYLRGSTWYRRAGSATRVNLALGTTIQRKSALSWKSFALHLNTCISSREPTGFPKLGTPPPQSRCPLSLTCVPS